MNEHDGNAWLPEKLTNRIYKLLHMPLYNGLLLILLLVVPQWVVAETLTEMLHKALSTGVEASGENIDGMQSVNAEKLFRRVFEGENNPELRQQWASLGFELTEKRGETGSFLVLREFGSDTNKYDGKGFFVFATDRESATVLQAPHSFYDIETGIIALELITKNNFRAAAWNTAPAKPPVHSPLSPDSHAPPARGYMLAFTRALLSIETNSHVVQLHSFEKNRTYTSNASHADIILSGYGEQSSQSIGWLGRCLKKELDYKVRIFPFEVQEMGAGEKISGANYSAVGELMQAEDSQGFVHLAMSGMFREELRSYPQVQQEMVVCLSRQEQ